MERDGVTGITFDNVAAEANLTRGRMMYHFPSREDMLLALHQHLAGQWEESLQASACKSAEASTPTERSAAYASVAARAATRAELALLVDSSTNVDLTSPWLAVLHRWASPAPSATASSGEVDLFIARLAADGLWMYEALTRQSLPKRVGDMVVERLKKSGRCS